jgi:3D (Asp-Asp-Asp) domain-containing protein
VQPGIPDPVHGLNVSEKVTVPTFKVMAEVDKYFELSSHPGSGAMVIHSVEGTQPRSYSHHWMSRLRDLLVDVASGSYRLVGGNDELAVSVPQIKFVGGMRMTEIVKDLKLTGCEQITLDTCTLDASSTANTLAVSNDIISLGSKVSIAAESRATSVSATPDTQSEPTTRWPCRRERYHITFERRYEMERIRSRPASTALSC